VSLVQRRAATAIAIASLLVFADRAPAQQRAALPAQRGGQPGPETPYILVTAFHAPTKKLAVEAADEFRSRLQGEHSAKELFVITKATVEATLQASGYPVDSALSVVDLVELGRALRAEYIVDGTAKKAGQGNATRFEVRVLNKTGQQVLTQPLPGVDGKDVGDAATLADHALTESLKQMAPYKACIAALRAGKYDDAAKSARLGIVAYPNAALARICLLNAYTSAKTAPPDSIITLANQILAIDSTSMLALANLAEAYTTKGDKAKALETYKRMLALDPANRDVAKAIVPIEPDPEKALAMIETLLKDNPGDVELVRTKWLLLLRMRQFKRAMEAGDDLVKLDTASASLDYYQRQVGAAQSDSNNAKIIEFAQKASQRFPKDASFPLLVAQTYRKQGQLPQALQAARAATAIDPKDTRGWMLAIVTAKDMNQPDTAVAIAKSAVAAGADKEQLGNALLQILAPIVKKAQDSKERADWEAALSMSQTIDAIVPSPASKFYVGLSSFYIGLDALQNAQKLGADKGKDAKESKAKACAEAKVTEDMWANATLAMTTGGGGAYNKDGGTQVMAAIQQYGEYIPQMKKAYCAAK
jgi:tetratricopeptide (TPR) repeat protein/TolB-like protein